VEIRSPPRRPPGRGRLQRPRGCQRLLAHDILSLGFKKSPPCGPRGGTRRDRGGGPAGYAAIFLVGGQSPMFTFRGDERLPGARRPLLRGRQGDGASSATPPACLLETRLSSGERLVKGGPGPASPTAEERFRRRLRREAGSSRSGSRTRPAASRGPTSSSTRCSGVRRPGRPPRHGPAAVLGGGCRSGSSSRRFGALGGRTMRIAFIGHGDVGGPSRAPAAARPRVTVSARTGSRRLGAAPRAEPRRCGPRRPPRRWPAPRSSSSPPFGGERGGAAPLRDALAGRRSSTAPTPWGPGLSHGLDEPAVRTEQVQAPPCPGEGGQGLPALRVRELRGGAGPGPRRAAGDMYCGSDAAAKSTVAGAHPPDGWSRSTSGGPSRRSHSST